MFLATWLVLFPTAESLEGIAPPECSAGLRQLPHDPLTEQIQIGIDGARFAPNALTRARLNPDRTVNQIGFQRAGFRELNGNFRRLEVIVGIQKLHPLTVGGAPAGISREVSAAMIEGEELNGIAKRAHPIERFIIRAIV